VLDCGSKY